MKATRQNLPPTSARQNPLADLFTHSQNDRRAVTPCSVRNKEAAIKALSAWPSGLQVGAVIPTTAVNTGSSKEHVIVTSHVVFKDGQICKHKLQTLVDKRLVSKNDWYWIQLSSKTVGGTILRGDGQRGKVYRLSCQSRDTAKVGQLLRRILVHGVDVEGKKSMWYFLNI
jgi:phosphoribosylformimino-5-aminoimidazole carboxamide ribotide isomerase